MSVVLDGVCFAYRQGGWVIDDATISLADGELLAIMGPSGSGKSTLLQLIGRLLTPQRGRVIGRPPLSEIRWVFQVPTALGRRSVLDNIMLGVLGSLPRDKAIGHAVAAASAVGVSDLANQPANSLSGGELQRVQVARALVGEPKLVLADEPTGQLDAASTGAVVDALRAARSPRSAVIVATHDSALADACDRVLEIRNGKVLEGA